MMTYTGSEYSEKDLFQELKENVGREGIRTFVQYKDLIDEIVEEKRIYGFFSDDEDLTQIKDDLQLRWTEIERKLERKNGIIASGKKLV